MQIANKYYPKVVDLLKACTGGSRVHIFDHTIRKATSKYAPAANALQKAMPYSQSASSVSLQRDSSYHHAFIT